MAAIHPPASNHYEPQARSNPCTAFVNGKIVMYGGFMAGTQDTLPPTVVDEFDPSTEKWDQITTTGPPPPGFIAASCAVIGIYLYVFSGRNGITYFNNIHQLNTHSLEWTELDDANQGEAPMAKTAAAMVSYNARMLITIGGYGILPYHRRPGTEYILDPDYPGCGWTNELLCFNLDSRTWSSPHTTGTPPPASVGHSFTMVDLHRAVLFGGGQLRRLLPNYVYILDVQQWMWTTIAGGGPGWPVHRASHSAVSLHHSDGDLTPDPALMVMWGTGPNSVILSDSWVFQVNVRQWRKVTLPDTLKGRCLHSTTIVHTGSTLKKLVTYGGLHEFPRNPRDLSTHHLVAETTVVDIESLLDVWVVTAVRQLGRRSTPSSLPLTVPSDLQVQPPAPSLLTPWLAPGLLTQQPAAMLPQPAFTAPTLQPYLGAGIHEMQPEHQPFIPPIEAPPLPYYDEYPATSIPPPQSIPPTIPRPQYWIPPVMSSAGIHQVEALPAAALFPQPSSDRGPQAAVQTTDSAILPQATPASYSSAPPQEPPSSDQESEPTVADIKPKLEVPSPKDEKPTLKTEPASPTKKEIKVKPLNVSEQDEDLVLKEVALLREIVAHQKKQIMELQETVQMYEKTMQEAQTLTTTEQAVQKSLQEGQTLPTSEQAVQKPLQEGQTLPTSEQAVRTYGENTSDVTTTEYLRGFESFAETSFAITGTHSHSFEWQGYGLKLHIPEGAVPADHSECRIDIKVGLSGQFSFPDDSHLVSCVYWISCPHKFVKAVTLDIEHCSSVQHSSQCSNFRLVAARCSQEDLPYHFKELQQATFSPQSSFGSVQVSQFSFFGIIAYNMCWWLRHYCAIFYYKEKSINEWWLYFFITWDLSGCHKAIETKYAGRVLGDDDIELVVEFQEPQNSILLDIPKGGTVLESGWKITPMTDPVITKQQVDQSCQLGRRFPHHRLSIKQTREDEPIELEHILNLIGTKDSKYVCIKRTPEGLRKHGQKRRHKPVEHHYSGNSKREKLSSKPEIQTEDIPEAVSPSSSEDAATPMAEEVDKLDQDNHIEITGYLLGLDKTHIYRLGLVLGLSEPRVREMEDSKTFLDGMVVAWLQKVDQVQKRGAPSWRRLVEALRDRRVGQNGIARKILQDRILKQY